MKRLLSLIMAIIFMLSVMSPLATAADNTGAGGSGNVPGISSVSAGTDNPDGPDGPDGPDDTDDTDDGIDGSTDGDEDGASGTSDGDADDSEDSDITDDINDETDTGTDNDTDTGGDDANDSDSDNTDDISDETDTGTDNDTGGDDEINGTDEAGDEDSDTAADREDTQMSIAPMSGGMDGVVWDGDVWTYTFDLSSNDGDWYPTRLYEDGNRWGWQLDTEIFSSEVLKQAQYLVLEVNGRPRGGFALGMDIWDGIWAESYFDVNNFEDSRAKWDNPNSKVVIKLDEHTLEMNGYDEEDEDWYTILSDSLAGLIDLYETGDEYYLAFLMLSYSEYDNWDAGTGREDLGLISAYLTNEYDYDGIADPMRRVYDISAEPGLQSMKGFRIYIDDYDGDEWNWGDVKVGRIYVYSDGDDEHYDNRSWELGWDQGWFVQEGGRTYIEFDWNGNIFEDEPDGPNVWRCVTARIDIGHHRSHLDMTFGDIEFLYDTAPFPRDLNEWDSIYGTVMYMKNLGFYQDLWGRESRFAPRSDMNRIDFAQILMRINGTTWDYNNWLINNYRDNNPPAPSRHQENSAFGDIDYWDNWQLEKALYVLQYEFMTLKSGLDWWHNPENDWIWEETFPYTDEFRSHDALMRGELFYGAAALAGLSFDRSDAAGAAAKSALASAGFDIEDGPLDEAINRSEIYTLLEQAVKYHARDEIYELPEPYINDDYLADITWVTHGFGNETWVTSDPVSLPAFRQYNTLVIELEDGTIPWENWHLQCFFREAPGIDGGQYREPWNGWDSLWWHNIYDPDTNTVTINYGVLDFWPDSEHGASKFGIQFYCCDYEWVEAGGDGGSDIYHKQEHQPGCMGAWAQLNAKRAYLTNTTPRYNIPGPGFEGYSRYNLGSVTWGADNPEWSDSYKQRGWQTDAPLTTDILRAADNLVLRLDGMATGEFFVVLQSDSDNWEWRGSNGIAIDGEYINIDLRALLLDEDNLFHHYLVGAQAAGLIIVYYDGETWYHLGVKEAWLEGDFRSVSGYGTDQPIFDIGFTPEQWKDGRQSNDGRFYVNDWEGTTGYPVQMSGLPHESDDGYALHVTDRTTIWSGLEIDAWGLVKGAAYYYEIWFLQESGSTQGIEIIANYRDGWRTILEKECPSGEWTLLSGMFTVDMNVWLNCLQIITLGEEYYVPEIDRHFLIDPYDYYIDNVSVWGPAPQEPFEYDLPGPHFEGFDTYYLGKADADWTFTKGWDIWEQQKSFFAKADYLYLQFDGTPSVEIEFGYSFYDPDYGWDWDKQWEVVYRPNNQLLPGNVLKIDLKQIPNYYRGMAAQSSIALMVGHSWYEFGITAAWLEGDFFSFDDYDEPFVKAGFEDEDDMGGFEARGSVITITGDPQAPEGSKVLRISEREETSSGAQVSGRNFIPGEIYYVSAWVKHDEPDYRSIDFTMEGDPYPRAFSVYAPGGEWTQVQTLFIAHDNRFDNLYFETDWYEDPTPDQLFDFYIDGIEIWGPLPPPPPNILYPVSTSLKDIYRDIFNLGVGAEEGQLGLEFAAENVAGHYNLGARQLGTSGALTWGTPDYTVVLDGSGGYAAALATLPSFVHPSYPGQGAHVCLEITGAATSAEIEGAMALLIANKGKVNQVIFSNIFDLFDYDDGMGGRFRFIPKDAYFLVAMAPLGADVYTGSNVIINQVYGSGPLDGTGSISHSFIELYNPTASAIDLGAMGYSLQIQNGHERIGNAAEQPPTEWYKRNFNAGETIQPYSSLLIRLHQTDPLDDVSYIIENADIDWEPGIILSNRAFSAALVSNVITLPTDIGSTGKTFAELGVVDITGAANTYPSDLPLNGNGTPARISKQVAARRIAFGAFDGADDLNNYESIDYRNLSMREKDRVRPRWSGDGQWGRYTANIPEGVQLTFSQEAGVFSSRFDLTLAKDGDEGIGIIWYTLDGSEPVPYSKGAFIYDGAIDIRDRSDEQNYFADINLSGATFADWGYQHHSPPYGPIFKGNVVRAAVYDVYGNALTNIITHTYLINPPSEFEDMPIISISANEYDLFDPADGIFRPHNSAEKGAEWEKLTYFEFFDNVTGYEREVAQNLGMRIHGGWSRGNPQKSLRFYASSSRDAENPSIEYDIFDGAARDIYGNPITSFRRILLRNFGNDSGGAYMRDNIYQDIARGTNMATQDYRYAIVMLNGEFWGMYELRERIDEYMAASNYGLSSGNIVVFENPHPDTGAAYDEAIEYPADHELYMQMGEWFRNNPDLSDELLYREAQRYIDIDSLIDMYILESYGANFDWPNNNTRTWRYQTTDYPSAGAPNTYTDGRWRFILNDMDGTFSIYGASVYQDYFSDESSTSYPLLAEWNDWTLFWRTFMTNDQFRDKFVNRYFDIMNTHLRPENISSIISRLESIIAPVVDLQGERWNKAARWQWQDNVNNIRSFNDNRQWAVISQLMNKPEFGITDSLSASLSLSTETEKGYINLNGIDIKPGTPGVELAQWMPGGPEIWHGIYPTGLTQTITAVPEPGYQLSHFEVYTDRDGPGGAEIYEDYVVVGNTMTITLPHMWQIDITAVFTDAVPADDVAVFELPSGTTGTRVSATDGTRDANLAFVYANGANAAFNGSNAPVNAPNNAGGWYPSGDITADDSAGWILTLDTRNYENLTFSAAQGSTNAGPGEFKLAYRIGTSGEFTDIGVTSSTPGNISSGSVSETFNNIPLPAAMENRAIVQLKIYISSKTALNGSALAVANGNTSINNIIVKGFEIEAGKQLYRINIGSSVTGGTITANPPSAFAGDMVILTPEPGDGWQFVPGSFKYNDGTDHVIIGNTFTMPASDVTVTGEFELEGPLNVIAEWKYTDRGVIGTAAPATGGVWKNASSMEGFYADGVQATLGRSQADRNPINVSNNAAGWYPASGAINADNAAGWVFTFSTVDCDNIITFSADQQTSGSGPRDFKLAYRLGTNGEFIDIPYSENAITHAGDTMENTYYLFPLPAEVKNQEVVQLKLYIASTVSRSGGILDRSGGNHSINNVEILQMDPDWIPREIGFDITGAGTVTADKRIANSGETVTLTINTGGWKLVPDSLMFNDGATDTPITAITGNTATFIMPDASVTIKATFEMINPAMLSSDVIINQVGAKSSDTDPGGISHSFVELYNTSGSPVNLNGKTLQIANASGTNGSTGGWIVLPLRGTIPAGGYYLIVIGSDAKDNAPYQITEGEWDRLWSSGLLSNRGFSAALVNGTRKLPEVMDDADWMNILDFVGTHNASELIKNTLGTGTARISASQAVRRINHANTGNNAADFEAVRYADYTQGNPAFAGKLPQWSGLSQTTMLPGDANGDGRVNGTDVQAIILWVNSGRTTGWVDEDAAKVTNTNTGRPDTSDALALIMWINSGGSALTGYTSP